MYMFSFRKCFTFFQFIRNHKYVPGQDMHHRLIRWICSRGWAIGDVFSAAAFNGNLHLSKRTFIECN